MIKADTPFAPILEMHAVVLGVPALILLASAAIVALTGPWRFSSSVGLACKLASGIGSMAVAVALAQGAFFSDLARC